jgi:hypothetical protein
MTTELMDACATIRSDQMLSSADSSDDEAGDFRNSRAHSAAEEGFSEPESSSDEDEQRSSNGAGAPSVSTGNGAGEPGNSGSADAPPPQQQRLRGVVQSQDGPHPQSADAFEHPESADAAALAGHPEGARAGQSIDEGAVLGCCAPSH